ncbi:hypothetical protein PAUR_a1105 [Pseudoalteromonas aurantia 208]|uniref:Orphan protein n=1 Tax=Pseudoalteromonas aurantia 208 TaxID=1314867 RepID=A0ABR9E9M2_9GAMM|nr:hypothetical protein [Pseudoalteromonas aurantia 208]
MVKAVLISAWFVDVTELICLVWDQPLIAAADLNSVLLSFTK